MDPLENLHDPVLMHFQYIFNLIQSYRDLKFFDIRDKKSFEISHLRIAIHVPIDSEPISLEMLKKITAEKELSRLRRNCLIIGYSSLYLDRFHEFKVLIGSIKCREVHYLHDFDLFLEKYAFLCSNFRSVHVKQFPNEIIPKVLYLGTQVHAQSREVLEILKVTHIVNVTRGPAIQFPGIKYCKVSVEDSESEKISFFFRRAFEFIEKALVQNSEGRKNVILVHCAQGVSRSSTIVVMFLMRGTGMTLEEALSFVKRHRSVIEPNEGFMKELREFERSHNEFVRRKNGSLTLFSLCFNEEVKMENSLAV